MEEEDLLQCRQAELDFLSSAYSPNEVWWEYEDEKNVIPRIYRRLARDSIDAGGAPLLAAAEPDKSGDGGTGRPTGTSASFSFILELNVQALYPYQAPLRVFGRVDEEKTDKKLLKRAYDALPLLISRCRETAESALGGEAVFAVFSAAEEWMDDAVDSGTFRDEGSSSGDGATNNDGAKASVIIPTTVLLGRRLIYSHHIISAKKRADMKRLFSEYGLTGYVKIGWPGLIIVEGKEDDCQAFYDEIRRWAWQYLVVRGEMHEEIQRNNDDEEKSLDAHRLFPKFLEVDDMSVVADHCRQVGLEDLFRTSMKQYGSSLEDAADNNNGENGDYDGQLYGALIHVDHFNDGKGYRRWLIKTSNQLGVGLLVKESFGCSSLDVEMAADASNNRNFSSSSGKRARPMIVVGLVGDSASVSSMLKKWRTTRVDVDSRGKPCLERMMKVLIETPLERRKSIDRLDWDSLHSDDQRVLPKDQLLKIIESIGGDAWVTALEELFRVGVS